MRKWKENIFTIPNILSVFRIVLAILFLIKESYMGVMGLKTISATRKNEGAMWYGKVNTAVFYGVMVLLFLFPGIPASVAEIMIALCGIFMLTALILYDRYFRRLQKEYKEA